MSEKNTTTTGNVTYAETPAAQPQTKMSYGQALDKLEKQHKLGRLQCEMAEFRVREVQANMYYLELIRKANADSNPTPSVTVTPTAVPPDEISTQPTTTSENVRG